VKENQPTLLHDIERLFAEAKDKRRRSVDEIQRPEVTSVRDVDSGHGRIEERTAYLSRDLSWLTTANDWKGLCGAGMVAAKRTNEVTNKEQVENRYYIVSDPSMTAERLTWNSKRTGRESVHATWQRTSARCVGWRGACSVPLQRRRRG